MIEEHCQDVRALATWCVRHRRMVLALWGVTLVLVLAAANGVGSNFASNFSLPHTESTEADQLLRSASPRIAGDREVVVFATSHGQSVTAPAVESRIDDMLARVRRVPHVSAVVSPYTPGAADQVSRSGTVAFATVVFDQQTQNVSSKDANLMIKTALSSNGDGVRVAISGQLAEQGGGASQRGTELGLVLAGVILFVAFGSLFAMLLPLISTMLSLGTAIGVIELCSNVLAMPDFSTELVLLIGLGVGIDYALFIVTRHRQGLLAGHEVEEAVVTSVNTSGRAVLFAGIIVCIALLGMFAMGISFLYGLAVAASIGVAFTMMASLTLLPALLGFIGPHALSRRERRRLRIDGPTRQQPRGFWVSWSSFVARRPVLPAVVALGFILLATVPFFTMRLGSADQGNDPVGSTTRTAYDLLAQGFGPGFNGPLQLVSVVGDPAERAALVRVEHQVAAQPGVASVTAPMLTPAHDGKAVALIDVYPTTSPQDEATTNLLTHLRQDTIPAAAAGSGLRVYVGGNTATFVDFANVLSAKLPLFVGIVILMSFLLLAVVFRSIVVPLTAAVMNLLSAGAAFGITTAVFQWGWFGGIIGVNRTGPIEAFLPVMLFSILFGLSMDYEVFLVTRIHEEWLRTGDNRQAVRNGLAATGRTITAAALIMILVFGSFILGGQRVIKEFGVGLAGGILVDAVVIRSAVVPSLMLLFGRANWWFPGWLDRILPRISVDVPEDLDDSEPLADETDTGGQLVGV